MTSMKSVLLFHNILESMDSKERAWQEEEEIIYGSRRVPIPAPHFVVFYNGRSPHPERQVMRLSDAFRMQENGPQLELQVLILNTNEGYNAELKKQCRTLDEYMQYVDRVRGYAVYMSKDIHVQGHPCPRTSMSLRRQLTGQYTSASMKES